MALVRDAILSAVSEADRLHKQFDTKARTDNGEGRINVFEMLVHRDVPVMFRPLKGLLGAFLDNPAPGVLVTTQRQLPVQRFTAAHELGHATLGHETSLDLEDTLARSPFVEGASYDLREIQANAFASQLLAPSWLIVKHMQRQGWMRDRMTDPAVVYQLSLRLGTSYSATCHALTRHRVISKTNCNMLIQVQPKAVKQARGTLSAQDLVSRRVADYRARRWNRPGGKPVRPGCPQIHGTQRVRLCLAARRPGRRGLVGRARWSARKPRRTAYRRRRAPDDHRRVAAWRKRPRLPSRIASLAIDG